MTKTIQSEADSRFLPHISINNLQKKHKKEKNPKAATRLLACIMRKKGKTIRHIAATLNKSVSTIHRWLTNISNDGIKKRYDKKIPGCPSKMSHDQLKELRKDLVAGPQACGFESGVWTAPLLREHIEKKYGVKYATSSIYDILEKMGFSCRRPRPKHPKSASKSEIKEFKKKASEFVKKYKRKGYTILAVDSASHIIGWNIKNGWYPKGRPVTTPVSLSRKRFHSFGALYENGLLCNFYDKANSKSFCDFIEEIHKEFGKAVLFLDNAAIHKSKDTLNKLDEFGVDILLYHIPPYTPELNPIEIEWRMIKKGTANTLYTTTDAMKDSIRKMLKNGEIKVAKMFDYLS